MTVCLSCSQNRPLKVGPQSKAQKQTLVMFEGCNCSSRVMFLFSLWPRWINSRSHLTSGLACQSPERELSNMQSKETHFFSPPFLIHSWEHLLLLLTRFSWPYKRLGTCCLIIMSPCTPFKSALSLAARYIANLLNATTQAVNALFTKLAKQAVFQLASCRLLRA